MVYREDSDTEAALIACLSFAKSMRWQFGFGMLGSLFVTGLIDMNSLTLFGIKNCDTVRKARKHLDAANHPHEFHDFRDAGLSEATLDRWLTTLPYTDLLNTRSTSWRALPDTDKADLTADKAKALMLANPTLIKRPVLEGNGVLLVGFKAAQYDEVLSHD